MTRRQLVHLRLASRQDHPRRRAIVGHQLPGEVRRHIRPALRGGAGGQADGEDDGREQGRNLMQSMAGDGHGGEPSRNQPCTFLGATDVAMANAGAFIPSS